MKQRKIGIIAGIVLVVIAAAGVALWNYHEQPQFCALCHIMKPYLESWNGSDMLAHVHAEADVACLDCHEPTMKEQIAELTAFVTGDYQQPLRERRFGTKEWCLGCHEETYPDLVVLTAERERNPHDSHWGEMDCRICHKVHRESVLYCTQCHDDVELPENWTISVP